MDQERRIDMIIVHCSDSREDDPKTPKNEEMDIGAAEIEEWHKARAAAGEPWMWYSDLNGKPRYIGYHYVVRRNGVIETARPEEKIGNHAKGVNKNSIGVCWIGRSHMTEYQKGNLVDLCAHLCIKHSLSTIDIYGHYQFSQNKTCPNFTGPNTFESIDDFRNKVEMAIREIK